MIPYSILPLVSGLFLLTLSIITISYGRNERVNTVFSAFAFCLSLASFSSFLFYQADSLEQARLWVRFPFLFMVPAMLLALYYTLVITGFPHRSTKISKSILQWYIVFLFAAGAIIEFFTIATDWLVFGVEFYQGFGFEHTHGKLFVFAAVILLLINVTVIGILYHAYRSSDSEPQRILYLYNLVGFSIAYFLTAFIRFGYSFVDFHVYALSYVHSL